MKIIKIIPTKGRRGSWTVCEAPGVEPFYVGQGAKERAIAYAQQRFAGGSGEIHIYDEKGEQVVEVMKIAGGSISRPARFERE